MERNFETGYETGYEMWQAECYSQNLAVLNRISRFNVRGGRRAARQRQSLGFCKGPKHSIPGTDCRSPTDTFEAGWPLSTPIDVCYVSFCSTEVRFTSRCGRCIRDPRQAESDPEPKSAAFIRQHLPVSVRVQIEEHAILAPPVLVYSLASNLSRAVSRTMSTASSYRAPIPIARPGRNDSPGSRSHFDPPDEGLVRVLFQPRTHQPGSV